MYGYNKKELINFIKEQVCGDLSIASISERGHTLPGYLGNGISRTTFAFSKYPNIVFKICVGSDGDICIDDAEREAERWERAVEEDVAPYFAETEYLCDIKLYGNTWEKEYGEVIDYIDYSHSYEVPVYIQSRVDEIWCESEINRSLHSSKNSLIKEKKIFESLEDCWISEVDNDRLFSALFIRKYGTEEYKKLAQFIVDYGIEDLHGANWGIKDGDLVIIDYAM